MPYFAYIHAFLEVVIVPSIVPHLCPNLPYFHALCCTSHFSAKYGHIHEGLLVDLLLECLKTCR